ncbi:MAG: hypothetical protein ACRDYX_05185 [Egibacteraceae bacterium]
MIVVLPIIGPAIVGSGQYLAWTPCHQQSVRLQEDEVTDDFTAVHCTKCSVPWEITFKKVGVDWLALWWP